MGERQCRNCNQPADAGVYRKRCADEIMAKALKSPSGGREIRVHRSGPATTAAAQMRLMG